MAVCRGTWVSERSVAKRAQLWSSPSSRNRLGLGVGWWQDADASQMCDEALRPVPVVTIPAPKGRGTGTGAEVIGKRLQDSLIDPIDRTPACRCPVGQVRRTA